MYGAFQDFHAYFSPLFGRRESRERGRDYLQALLVQSQDRRNADYGYEIGISGFEYWRKPCPGLKELGCFGNRSPL